MRKSKLFRTILVFALAFTLGACGTGVGKDSINNPSALEPVESIRILNEQQTLTPGAMSLAAQCLPIGADADFTATIESKLPGVWLDKTNDGYKLMVAHNAQNGAAVNVRVASAADPSKIDTRTFTLSVDADAFDYTPIRTEEDLRAVGAGEKALSGKYKLFNDITLEREWKSIGTAASPFNAYFDGNGYSIKNISMAYGTDLGAGMGFFGVIGAAGAVKNVGFDNAGTLNRMMNMGQNSGVVAGVNNGVIENVFTNVNLVGQSGFAAALVGVNNGTLTNGFALGNTLSKQSEGDSAGLIGSSSTESTATGVFADKDSTGLSHFYGAQAQQATNADKLLSTATMQTAATFTAAGYSADVWYLKDGFYPALKNETSVEPSKNLTIEIVNKGTEIEVGLYAHNTVPIATKRSPEAREYEIEYSMEPVAGVTLDAQYGYLTFEPDVLDGKTITFTASLKGTNISDTKTYDVCNDGYKPSVGMMIGSEADLYKNLIIKADKSNETRVMRNMTRKLKLSADIELNDNKAWPGIPTAFKGVFDGQGYTISGLDVPTTVASNGYGFFMDLQGTVEKLTLKGKIDGLGLYVGGLVKELKAGGNVKNVLVDMSIDTNGVYSGKIAARMHPGSHIVNTIGKGHMGSSLPLGAQTPGATDPNSGRTSWGPYACGALVGRDGDDKNNPHTIKNSVAVRHDGDNAQDVGLTIRSPGTMGEGGSTTGSEIITFKDSLNASKYNSKGFNGSIWHIVNQTEPMLKYPGFVAPVKQVYVFITNSEKVFNVTDTDLAITLTSEVYNATQTPVWSLSGDALTGIAINSTTGVVTATASAIAEGSHIVTATLTADGVAASFTFSILKTDPYDPAVGVQIGTEDALYKNLIVDTTLGNAALVQLNLSRKIVLTADITLSKYANWPGIGSATNPFKGSFDGKGHTISGFNVTGPAGLGYGFFFKVQAANKSDVIIQNLELKGTISGKGMYVAGLVSQFTGGTIQNCLIDMSVQTNTNRAGKIVGSIKGNAVLKSCIAMGNISTTNSNASNETSWSPFECGALLGMTEDNPSGQTYSVENCYAVRTTYSNDADVGITIRRGTEVGEGGTYTNIGFKTIGELSSQAGLSTSIWTFDASGPSLKVQG